MSITMEIRLAQPQDAPLIAEMSREYIEYGLDWRWTRQRVLQAIRNSATNVAVAQDNGKLLGFGIMRYEREEAHLLLLSSHASYRRQGIGTLLARWLEECACLCGIRWLRVEVRADNQAALAFYQKLGYDPVTRLPDYYDEVLDAILLVKDCWVKLPYTPSLLRQ